MVKLVATLSSYGRRAVVVGGVADRYAGELARAGQSNRRRAGTGNASPQRATRPPLWPAGMAEGNRATFGPRVGLSSHGSPAKGGPKSKCLARVKIARTSAGPPSLTISDPSRFPPAGPEGERQVQLRRAAMGQQPNDRRGLIALESALAGTPVGSRGQGPIAARVVIGEPVVDRGSGDAEETGGDGRPHRVAHDRPHDPTPQVALSLGGEMASIEGPHTLSTLDFTKAPNTFCSE